MSHTATAERNYTSEQRFGRSLLPSRKTPSWEQVATIPMDTRNKLGKVITGRLPIGVLPEEIITESERLELVAVLRSMQMKQYENTSETEKVSVHGLTFVDSPCLQQYLAAENDREFEKLTTPLLHRVIDVFEGHGFEVKPLTDPTTLLPYHARVCREISVPDDCYTSEGNGCTVLHCDDLLRDGAGKPDFRIPTALEQMRYNQFSVCIQLEDGGYRPDDIIVYEKQYSREMEGDFYGDGGWRYDAGKLKSCRWHAYTPELRKCYMFSTLNFHDVRGGHRLSKRINFSVFFIYVPGTNTLYYYN
jgi:hypothetical protein